MNCANTIVIRAPVETIFAVTANLELWPKLLPHYRSIRVLARQGDALTVRMAARRGWLPIHWTARYVADARARELRFEHLRSFTKGMNVTWTFTPTPAGVAVRIAHDLPSATPWGRWFAEHILADLFIKPVATQTLRQFHRHLEQAPNHGAAS